MSSLPNIRCRALGLGLLVLAGVSSASTPPAPRKPKLGNILGADISFLPQLEARGIKFSDKGVQQDAIQILKDHGLNYIRLRIFNNPAADSGHSPGKGFCDLPHTLAVAKRVKDAKLKLLNFHYSDTWADPGKQFKPEAWKALTGPALVQAVYSERKREANDIAFNLPGGKGKGSFIWEPLNTWDAVFDKQGVANEKLLIYDEISKKYRVK
ncbi:MAG TPA: glycosyl hydrolase 53 family protein [Hymenobacter sp.]|jgi:hypothetical protein